MLLHNSKDLSVFQSTHPRGVRPDAVVISMALRSVSIHAPTRGATLNCNLYITFHVFQSTHPRGVRHVVPPYTDYTLEFQSTHPRGVRLLS